MARIIKKDDRLMQEYMCNKKNRNICWMVVAACFLLFLCVGTFIGGTFQAIAPILVVVFIGSGILGGYFSNKTQSLYSGIEGENTTADIISMLPDTYCGFQNIKVTYEGKTSELDMVVVGPTGVFVIETKNLNGTIVGHYDNPQWIQEKIGRKGTPYSKNFYNPIKQVGTHVYRLAKCLKSNGVRVYVQSMVYFSNPDTVIRVNGKPSETPVFSAFENSANEIRKYILENEPLISGTEVQKIANLLARQ